MKHAAALLCVMCWGGCGGGESMALPDARVDAASHDAAMHDDAARDSATVDGHVAADAAGTDSATHDASAGDATPGTDAGDAGADVVVPIYCQGVAQGVDPLPPSNMRGASLVQGGFGFVEGPVWLANLGQLLFSDMDMSTGNSATGPQSQIRRLMLPSTFDVFVPDAFSNGLALDRDGTILAATHDVQSISRINTATGVRTPMLLAYQGQRFNSPNDLAVRYDGNIYFTDPDWQIGTRDSETGITGVYRADRLGIVQLIDGTLDKPNGIALSPDGNVLYVGSRGADIHRFELNGLGMPGPRTRFATTGSSDGFTVDCAGNLYVTSGTVEVFAPDGTRHGEISVGEDPSNVAFGGVDRRTLYITARTGLYAIELNVPGLPY